MEMTREQLRAKLSGLEVSTAWKGIVRPLLDHDQAQRERIRTATQLIIAEIGASGPEDLEEAVGRAVGKLQAQAAAMADVAKAAEHWNKQYRDCAQQKQDDAARYGQQIVDLQQQLADVTKERDALKACQCDGCSESLEGDAYCLQCYERQRQRVDGLDERLGQLMADKDNQSRTIADMWQQLQQAQATIQRLTEERDEAVGKLTIMTDGEITLSDIRQSVNSMQQLTSAQDTIQRMEGEVKSLLAFKRSVGEALNSGDGSYRP